MVSEYEFDDVDGELESYRQLPESVRLARAADTAQVKREAFRKGLRVGFIGALGVMFVLLLIAGCATEPEWIRFGSTWCDPSSGLYDEQGKLLGYWQCIEVG